MYPSTSLLSHIKDTSIVTLPVDELIGKLDALVGVFHGKVLFFREFNDEYSSFSSPLADKCL